ncbi:GWxTD domain-containing protein [Lishizhenia tianjinensis]|uniref:GWxTD domain-containing protein n=1 Tax=Lishizhenia tianjinensis TaxID=477690 RepID=A0A1I6YGW0_9FLAO|nr:GWxTD domain-containing protein [Lishizhenia tianjinensis]SFT49642.1 GWxTD domain-containing protein [Lishizhenia tianjinensis]
MSKILTFILILSTAFSFAQNDAKLRAYMNEKQFYTPNGGNYLEVHLQFVGHTLYYNNVDSLPVATLEIVQIISQDDSIVVADKYRLNSPPIIDSLVEDFFDIQRYALDAGDYVYELMIQDINSGDEAVSVMKNIRIEDLSAEAAVSDIVLAERISISKDQNTFSKIGYDVVPMLTNYYPSEFQFLPYYVELYNIGKDLETDSNYVVFQRIYDSENKLDLSAFNRMYKYQLEGEIKPIAKSIDITNLPAGSYLLEVSVVDAEQNLIASNVINFDRNNYQVDVLSNYQDELIDPAFQASITSDSLRYYLASLIPISSQSDVKNIIQLLKEEDTTLHRKYIQSYWKTTSSIQSFENWMKYKAQVQLVERLYATNFQVGFETDRGRVYLQYGSPSSITARPTSPSEYPYEIWQYDKIGKFSNKRFVFYNPDMVNNTYRLLHSDMVGELQNYRWQYYINSRTTPGNDIDDPTGGSVDSHGANASRYYKNF